MEPSRTDSVYTFERAVFYKLQDAVRPRASDQGVSTCSAHAHTLTRIDELKDWKSRHRRSQEPSSMNRGGEARVSVKSKEVVRYADSESKESTGRGAGGCARESHDSRSRH